MRNTICFLLTMLLCYNIGIAQDQNIHLIQILDYRPNDSRNGDYVMRTNANRTKSSMEDEVTAFAGALGLSDRNVKQTVFSNVDFSPNFEKNKILSDVDKMQIGKNDIVFLVYFGHGFKAKNNSSRYPDLLLDAPEGTKVDVEEQMRKYSLHSGTLIDKIVDKKPAIVLSLITACNDSIFVDTDYAYVPKNEKLTTNYTASAGLAGRLKVRYDELFVKKENATTSVEFISALSGQKSYYNEETYGGFFLDAFKQVFGNHVRNNQKAEWASVAIEAHKTTVNNVHAQTSKLQQPIAQVRYFSGNYQQPQVIDLTKEILKTHKPTSPVKPPKENESESDKDKPNSFDYYLPNPTYGNIDHAQAVRMVKLGNSYRETNCMECATEAFKRALPVLQASGDIYFEAAALEGWGLALLATNEDQAQAKNNLKEAHRKYVSIGSCGSANIVRKYLEKVGESVKSGNCEEK